MEYGETALAERTMTDFARSTAEETNQLTEDLLLLKDVLAFRGVEEDMSVELVVCVLTDKEEIIKFMGSLEPESKVRGDYFAVIRIVTCLTHWQAKEVIFLFDTVQEAIAALEDRVSENQQLLEITL